MRGSCEVERDASSLETHEEDSDIRVVCELFNHAVPVIHAHAALQTHTLHTRLRITKARFNQSNKLYVQAIKQTTCSINESDYLFCFQKSSRGEQTMTGNSAHTEHNMCKGVQT